MKNKFSIVNYKLSIVLALGLALIGATADDTGDVLRVYSVSGTVMKSVALEDVQRLTFSGGNLLLKTNDGIESSFVRSDISRMVIEDEVTGISIVKNNIEIKLYPNPTSGQLIIDNGQLKIEKVEIYDIMGKALNNFQLSTLNSQLSIDVSHLPSGIYLMAIGTEQGTITKRFVKQ